MAARATLCGSLFTQAKDAVEGVVPGTLARSLVLNDHTRAGDIVYVMRADEASDAHGIVGGCYDDSHLPVGGGTHGGLSQYELHNVCVACGPAFQQGSPSLIPSGTVDLLRRSCISSTTHLAQVEDASCPRPWRSRTAYAPVAQSPTRTALKPSLLPGCIVNT